MGDRERQDFIDVEVMPSPVAIYDPPRDPEDIPGHDLGPLNTLEDLMVPVLAAYNKKHGTSIEFKTLDDALHFYATAPRQDVDISRLISSDLISSGCDYVIYKAVLVAIKLIDVQVTKVQSCIYNDDVNAVSIGMIDKVFFWVQSLENIKSRYNVLFIDRQLEQLKQSPADSLSMSRRAELIRLLLKESATT